LVGGTREITHFALPPILCCGMALTEGSHAGCEIHTRAHTHTHSLTQLKAPPPARTHSHIPTLVCLYNPRPALFSLSIRLTSVSTLPPHRLLWVTQSPSQRNIIQDIYRGADSPDNGRAAWGAACHVFPNTTSGSPARVSYAGTGKEGQILTTQAES
jgi:hypothetical protein